MRRIRILGFAVAVLALAVAATSASAAEQGKGKKHKGRHAHGVVTKIDKDKDGGSFTVKITEHKKKDAAATAAPAETPPVEKTFKVTADTKFFKAPDKKGDEKQPAAFGDLKDGEHVVVSFEGDVAKEVTIHGRHHKKKAAA